MFGFRLKSSWPFITRKAMDVAEDQMDSDFQHPNVANPNLHQRAKVRATKIKRISEMGDDVLAIQIAKQEHMKQLGGDHDWLDLLKEEQRKRKQALTDYLLYLEEFDDEMIFNMAQESAVENGVFHPPTLLLNKVVRMRRLSHNSPIRKYSVGDTYPQYVPADDSVFLRATIMMQFASTPDEAPYPTPTATNDYQGKNGTFDGGGASGDWSHQEPTGEKDTTESDNKIPNPLNWGDMNNLRVPENIPLNKPAYAEPLQQEPAERFHIPQRSIYDDPWRSSPASHTPSQDYTPPTPSYDPAPSYTPSYSPSDSGSSCDSGGGSSSCD